MDAMYLNLMFINPRPPVGARCTQPSLTPPPSLQKILDPPLPGPDCVLQLDKMCDLTCTWTKRLVT